MLEVDSLHVHYGGIHALKGISIEVPKGKIVTLIGANGAGKSSTLRAIAGLVKDKRGTIRWNGKDISRMQPENILKSGVALCPEGRRIFPHLTVMENLMLGAYTRDDQDGVKSTLDWVFELFPRLKERTWQKGGTLSGGEQQMLALGRALMSKPDLIMMDEPSLGLAPLLVKEVFEIIRAINEEGKTVLLVEQNAFAALKVAHYAYVLEVGSLVLQGPGVSLLDDPLSTTALRAKRDATSSWPLSLDPRPYKRPPSKWGSKGSNRQRDLSPSGTTSMWVKIQSLPAELSVPGTLRTKLGLMPPLALGSFESYLSTGPNPRDDTRDSMKSALSCSPSPPSSGETAGRLTSSDKASTMATSREATLVSKAPKSLSNHNTPITNITSQNGAPHISPHRLSRSFPFTR